MGLLLFSAKLGESEAHYFRAQATSGLSGPTRIRCLLGPGEICNQRREWSDGARYFEEALTILPEIRQSGALKSKMRLHAAILVGLGDSLEGRGDWAGARQCDNEAMECWTKVSDELVPELLGAFRRSGLELMRQGKPDLAIVGDLCYAEYFYTTALELRHQPSPAQTLQARHGGAQGVG